MQFWFSTIFGMFFMISQMLSTMALIIRWYSPCASMRPMTGFWEQRTTSLHDYGKLMLAFTMVWAYFAFSAVAHHLGRKSSRRDRRCLEPHLRQLAGGAAVALVLLQFLCPFCCCSRAN